MRNTSIDNVQNFVVGLLRIIFFDHSAWNVDDQYDYLAVQTTQIDLKVVLCGVAIILFKYHFLGVGKDQFF